MDNIYGTVEIESRVFLFVALSIEFHVYFVLEVSKPQAAVKVQEEPRKPEVSEKPKKVEKKVTPQEETKPGI